MLKIHVSHIQCCQLSKIIFFFCFSNHQARKQQAQNNSNQRIKFAIDSSLRIEHSLPFAKDFQLTLSGGGELIRHRVAFFTEDQGLGFIAFLQDKEVQVIRLRDSNRGSARKISFVSMGCPNLNFEIAKVYLYHQKVDIN